MNPEFQRNLWLEAGPRRLAWAGVALAAVYAAAMVLGQDSDLIRGARDRRRPGLPGDGAPLGTAHRRARRRR